ncbi:ketoacyl-synthetase C-terminal extension domain-containing protein, partial [Streptomyces griseus]
MSLLTESREWPETGRPRRAGVSSFGISGTNAHVILEQAPRPDAPDEAEPGAVSESMPEPTPESASGTTAPSPAVPWTLSARTAEGLREQAARLLAHVEEHTGTRPADVGHSLLATRSLWDHRAVVVGTDDTSLRTALAAAAAGEPGVVSGVAGGGARPVFVFPGQGAQWSR